LIILLIIDIRERYQKINDTDLVENKLGLCYNLNKGILSYYPIS